MAVPLSVRAYEPGDAPRVEELVSRAFGARSDEMLRWRYEHGPGRSERLVLCGEDGTVIGFAGAVYGPGWVRGRPVSIRVIGDLVSEQRGRGGGRTLIEHLIALRGSDVHYAFPRESIAELVTRAGRTPLEGRLPQWVRWVTPAGLAASRDRLSTPARAAARVTLTAINGLSGRPRRWSVAPIEPTEEIDTLADQSASFARCILRRDAAYLRWRWLDQPGGRWTLLGVRDGSRRLRGIAVAGRKDDPDAGAGVGRIPDLLADGPVAIRTLLDGAVRRLAGLGCGTVLLDVHDRRPWAPRAYRRAGFLPRGRGPNVHLAARRGLEVARELDNWYLTLGDTDLA